MEQPSRTSSSHRLSPRFNKIMKESFNQSRAVSEVSKQPVKMDPKAAAGADVAATIQFTADAAVAMEVTVATVVMADGEDMEDMEAGEVVTEASAAGEVATEDGEDHGMADGAVDGVAVAMAAAAAILCVVVGVMAVEAVAGAATTTAAATIAAMDAATMVAATTAVAAAIMDADEYSYILLTPQNLVLVICLL